ncbi:hypothetical protein IE53DRAFT_322005 [Violaceomyces palustris]|uniref:Uncharacterized protein n=1 Tax=Violaceomyces palustris TaxID=1673888 RepID=A0ACD0NME7_9BASI|nr:hypothetical protein IE53DRAFT_322005 [Violaceomyces palustris]
MSDIEERPPTTVLLLRTPVPTSQGTDPYHDAFGSFCLPSFASSALESGSSTPLPNHPLGPLSTATDHQAVDLLKSALSTSPTGRRRGKFIKDTHRLMTHHLAYPVTAEGEEIEIEYCVTSFPILDHQLVNTKGLSDTILRGHSNGFPYRGVIVTSQRAVEAWVEAGRRAQEALRNSGKKAAQSPTQWNRIPFFAVGPATATALRNIALPPWLRPRLVMGGEATGTGEALGNYVVKHFSSPSLIDASKPREVFDPPTPILYLVGDKNAPTIPQLLASAPQGPIAYEEIQCYETCLDPDFFESCEALAKSLPTLHSRPASRRPSNGSLSRPGSRRPSGGQMNGQADSIKPNGNRSGQSSRRPSNGSIHEAEGGGNVGSFQTKNGVLGSLNKPAGMSALPASPVTATVPLPAQSGLPVAPTVSLEPESLSAAEEDSLLRTLQNRASTAAATTATTSTTTAPRKASAKPEWIVFFSPSGVGYALDEFRKRRWLPPAPPNLPARVEADFDKVVDLSKSSPPPSPKSRTSSSVKTNTRYPRIAVLGPTTKKWMIEHLGIEPDAMAFKPGPKELKDAIEQAELKLRRCGRR